LLLKKHDVLLSSAIREAKPYEEDIIIFLIVFSNS